jgi:hypothetical protein
MIWRAMGGAGIPRCFPRNTPERGKDVVEDAPIEAHQFFGRQTPDPHLGELLLDLTAQIRAEFHPRLDREEQAEIADGNAMERIEPVGAGAQIIGHAPR